MEHITVTIEDYTYDGYGVGKVDGFPYFVPETAVGDVVKIKETKRKKNLSFAEVVEYISTTTVQPACPYYSECGGCQIMHLSYEEQLKFKTNHVKQTLKRIGEVDVPVENCLGMEEPFHYRNKFMIPVQDGVAGLYKRGTHDIVEMDACQIADEMANKIVQFVKNIPGLNHVMVRNNIARTVYMLVLVSEQKLEVPVQKITDEFPQIVSIINNVHPISNTVIQEQYEVLFGEDKYHETLLGVDYDINHQSFFQINVSQTEHLYQTAISRLDVKDKVVIDAYAGLGSIGLSFAHAAKKVIAIEQNPHAVKRGREIASSNGIHNIEFYEGKTEEVVPNLDLSDVDILITDPPRKGCDEGFLKMVIDSGISEFGYISCNVATLARDISFLKDHFEIKHVQPVDMFPNTYHIETVVVMNRK